MANHNNILMDGRDIGTVVLPNAQVKIFLTASAEERAKRRFKELQEKQVATTFEEVLADIEQRDYQDYNRETPSIGGGLSLGYRLPVSWNNRWSVEFSLGAGVYSSHYDKFHNTPDTKDGLIVETVRKPYWGIDQAAVSLSYSFDLKKKGGKR
jgi:hypothetical protein